MEACRYAVALWLPRASGDRPDEPIEARVRKMVAPRERG